MSKSAIPMDVLTKMADSQAREITERNLERIGTRIKFRDGSVLDFACITAGPNDEPVHGGLSVCNPKDEYNWLQGKVVSTGRALKAMKAGKNIGKIKLPPDCIKNLAVLYAFSQYGYTGIHDIMKMAIPEEWKE